MKKNESTRQSGRMEQSEGVKQSGRMERSGSVKKNRSLLPSLAAGNIRKNGSTYLPYLGISIFAMFTYFVFDLIQKNDVIYTLPRGSYAVMMIYVGFYLLGFIMVPFLYYTNSFLIKRRKRELGLYSILGLEKKHIGVMMFWESLMLYVIVVFAALVLGLLFSRLLFLVLLNMTGMPVDVDFEISFNAVIDMLMFYGLVTLINLTVNLVQVGKSNPIELMSEAKGGERQPRFLSLWTLLGVLTLGLGYFLALTACFDSDIFSNFFIAVLSVVAGTYFLFTSGSIVFLRMMKSQKKLYYKPDNFITVSGMLYRMKKSAAGLSNICIFSTMAIITVVCSVTVYMGMDSIVKVAYEKEFELVFLGKDTVDRGALKDSVYALAGEAGTEISDYGGCAYIEASAYVKDGHFYDLQSLDEPVAYQDMYAVAFTTLEEFNRMEGKEKAPEMEEINLIGGEGKVPEMEEINLIGGEVKASEVEEFNFIGSEGKELESEEINLIGGEGKELESGEVIVYSTGADMGWESVFFGEKSYSVKEELENCSFGVKMEGNHVDPTYLIVAANDEELAELAQVLGVDSNTAWIYRCGFNSSGEDTLLDTFSGKLNTFVTDKPGFAGFNDHREHMSELKSSYGGLLFVGVFYGLIFLICLVVTMYYKQVTEGFEDQCNFEIMQKIGMSDGEIRRTIKKQIRMVFLLPLAGAFLHTAVGMRMVGMLMGAIRFYEKGLLFGCAALVSLVFSLVYIFCYRRTSQAYYRIVRQM